MATQDQYSAYNLPDTQLRTETAIELKKQLGRNPTFKETFDYLNTGSGNTANNTASNNQSGVNMPTPEPTVGEVFGGFVPGQNQQISDAEKRYLDILNEQTAQPNEAEIRQNTMDRFQAEIDALNRVYAEKKAAEEVRGQGRIGSSTAIQARRGLIGSDFGASQKETVRDYNTGIINAIDAEKQAAISSILSQVRNSAAQELAEKTAARKQGATEYLAFLQGQEARKAKRISDTVENAFYSGIELDDQQFAQMAQELGVDPQTLKAQYNKFKIANTQTSEAQKSFTVAPGASVYDPTTGTFITAPDRPADPTKPITEKIGDTLYQYDPATDSWNVVAAGASTSGETKVVDGKLLERNPQTGQWEVMFSGGDNTDEYLNKKLTPKEAADLNLPVGSTYRDAQQKQTQQKVDATTDVVTLVDSIVNDPALSAFTGPVGSKLPSLKTLTGATGDLGKKVDRLINLLTLENLDLMSGVLSETDIKILREGGTLLDSSQRKGNFVEELERLKNNALKEQYRMLGITDATYEQAVEQYGQEAIRKMIEEGLIGLQTSPQGVGFNTVGSDTQQATTGALSLGPITGYGSKFWKWGLDIDLKKGDPVGSDVDGEVIFAGPNGGFGNQVVVRDVNGNEVMYSHLDGINAQVGQRITRGQILGAGGNTGKTYSPGGGDGSHLDLTVKKPDGTYMTPEQIEQRLKTFA